MGKKCCAKEGSQDNMSRGHLLAKLTKEHYLQYFPRVFCGVISFDVALLSKYPIAWIAWHLKLAWSSLVTDVQTQAKYVVARVPMSIQIASAKDLRPKSTWNLALKKIWYKDLH